MILRSSHTSYDVARKMTLFTMSCVSELRIQERIISLHFFHEAYSSSLFVLDGMKMVPYIKPCLDLAFKEIIMALHHVE